MNAERGSPRYYVVKEAIEELITGLAPRTVIPTERVLAVQFETSRTTVRRAIGELVAEGRLERTQGSGTFVAPPKQTYVRQLTSFSQDADAQGRRVSSRVLEISRVEPDHDVQAALQLTPRERVHRVERVRLLDGVAHAHEVAYLAGKLPRLGSLLSENTSLYSLLADHYGIRIVEAEDAVETGLASPTDAALLGTEVGAPLLLVERLATDSEGRRVELTRSTFRGDRSRFVARLRIGDTPDGARAADTGARVDAVSD